MFRRAAPRNISPLGAECCGSELACASLDSTKSRCLWHRPVQRSTRSDKRGGHIQPVYSLLAT